MPIVTVNGGSAGTISIPITSADNAALAQDLLDDVSAGVASGAIKPYTYSGHGRLTVPHGESMMDLTGPGHVTIPATTTTVVIPNGRHDTLFGGDGASQLIVAGTGGISYYANRGAGTVIAGGGNNRIVLPGGLEGDEHDDDHDDEHRNHRNGHGSGPVVAPYGAHLVLTDAGNDTIVAGDGAATIGAGLGHNAIILGRGIADVLVSGHDWIQAGRGAATIDASPGGTALVWGDGGTINFIGGAGAATIVGGTGAVTAHGGSGGGVFVGGRGGNNLLEGGTGAVTLFGSGAGDRLSGGGVADLLVGGAGAETLKGGGGADHFLFDRGHAGGVDLIADFTLGQDKLDLYGFNRAEWANAIRIASVDSTGATVTLSDHTRITFAGFTRADLANVDVQFHGGNPNLPH